MAAIKAARGGTPTIRLVHLSDLHLEAAPEQFCPGVEAVLERAAGLVRALAPDVLIATGDLTTFGGSRRHDLTLAKRWLEQFGVPYLALAGNHDLGASRERAARYPDTEAYEAVPFAATHFATVFGPRPVASLDLGPARLLTCSLRAGDPDGSVPALRQALAESGKPVILCGHYPLRPVREEGPLSAAGAPLTGGFLPEVATPLQTLVEDDPCIRLYLAGHVHVNSLRPVTDRCRQITAGGLGPGGSTLRCYTLTDTTVRYHTVLGPGPLEFWNRAAPAMGPYPPEYHLGNGEERSGEISLLR